MREWPLSVKLLALILTPLYAGCSMTAATAKIAPIGPGPVARRQSAGTPQPGKPTVFIYSEPGETNLVLQSTFTGLVATGSLCTIQESTDMATWVSITAFSWQGATNFAFGDYFTNNPPAEFYRVQISQP